MSSKRKKKPLSAKLISMWHPTLNGDLRLEDVSGGSNEVAWFLHYDDNWKQWHEWDATIKSVSRVEKCAICTGKRLVVGINDLATRNPTVAAMWHPILNGKLTPQMFTEHSGEMAWWRHKDKDTGIWHEWPAFIYNLTGKKRSKCAVCHGTRVQLGVNDLTTTHSDLALEWHPTLNGLLTPQMVSKGSNIDIWWQRRCLGVLHEWHAIPKRRTGKKPQGCAICRGLQVQIGVNDLASQYPELALEWDYVKNKNLTPQMVPKGSDKKVFWKHKATNGLIHGWIAMISSRTGVHETGCPECANHGFDPGLPAHLYVLSAVINENQVTQFGISNDIRTRLVRHARSGFKNLPVQLVPFSKGSNARALELSILELMEEYGIPTATKQGIKFSGSTEAFCLEDAEEEFLAEFKELVGL